MAIEEIGLDVSVRQAVVPADPLPEPVAVPEPEPAPVEDSSGTMLDLYA